ncbi:MAG TPA: Spy/CpxP family protein refolding chaperone [Chthonomonadaceae bacterium]|nr:Spy/CpxP family protein refolding chaperone [Chthonomonadaceae bacterium]
MTLRFHLRKRCLTIGTAAALLLGATLALAQPPPPGPGGNGPGGPPPFGRPGGPPPFGGPGGPPPPITAATVPLPFLEAGLKLTDDQQTKIAQIQQQFRKQMRAQMPPPPGPGEGGPPDPQTMRAAMEKGREMEQQATHRIEAVLTSEQKATLPDLLDEARALQAAGIPLEAYNDLKLSADQRQQITAIGKKTRQEMDQKRQAAQQSGDFESLREAMRSTHQQAHEKVMAILTESQRETAQKFARQHRRPGPGGFGGPPGGFGPPPGGFGGPPPDGGGPPPGGQKPPPPPDDGGL